MEILQLYNLYLRHPSIKIDTRKIQPGDIFFALKGATYNGNHFAHQALSLGASFAVVDEETGVSSDQIINTPDVLLSLQQLAKHHREQFKIPFIAITGSNGKTTTKELVHAVLSSRYKTYTTEGNLNNHIGIPLTLLKLKSDAEMAVVEMGANHIKEIEGYCRYVQPDHGLITNFGKAHLEGFGSLEGVKKAKGELFNYLKKNQATAFVNTDDISMVKMSEGIKNIVSYGTMNGSVKGEILANAPYLQINVTGAVNIENLKTQLIGEYNLPNILAAISVGNYFGVTVENIKNSLESYAPSNSRSQLMRQGSNTIILDAYNANPSSMKAAIENFANMEGAKKILMLGSMMELGKDSKAEHENILKLIDAYTWYKVILTGDGFKNLNPDHTLFNNSLEAKEWFSNQKLKDTFVLIKGSRSMQMEKILE